MSARCISPALFVALYFVKPNGLLLQSKLPLPQNEPMNIAYLQPGLCAGAGCGFGEPTDVDEELEDIKAACVESNKITNPWAEIISAKIGRSCLWRSPPPSSSSGPASTLSSSTVQLLH